MNEFTFSPFNTLIECIDKAEPDPEAVQELQLRVENIRKRIPEKVGDRLVEICDDNFHPILEPLRKAAIHRFGAAGGKIPVPKSSKRRRVNAFVSSNDRISPVHEEPASVSKDEESVDSVSETIDCSANSTDSAKNLDKEASSANTRASTSGGRRVVYDNVPSSDSENADPPPVSDQVTDLKKQVAELKVALANARTQSSAVNNQVYPASVEGWTLPTWNKTLVRGINMVRTTEKRASKSFIDHKKDGTKNELYAYQTWNHFRYDTHPYAYIHRPLMPATPIVEQYMRDTDFGITCAGAFYLSESEYGRSDMDVFFRAFTELAQVARLPRIIRIEINQVRIDQVVEKNNFSFDTFFGHEITSYTRHGWNTVTIYVARPYNSTIQFRVDLVRRRTHTEAFAIAEQNAHENQVGPEYYIQEFTRVREVGAEWPSEVISLRDPVTMDAVQFPVRFEGCQHPQLFDLYTFSSLVKQYPRMTCPICGQPGSVEDIRGDAVVQDHIERMRHNGTLDNAESLVITLSNQAVPEGSSESGLCIHTEVIYAEDAVVDSEDEW